MSAGVHALGTSQASLTVGTAYDLGCNSEVFERDDWGVAVWSEVKSSLYLMHSR